MKQDAIKAFTHVIEKHKQERRVWNMKQITQTIDG
tara:strand:+ start:1789 stop:1893 length:105 start_codon:yes stop_codon:yes gene_type:complete